MSGRTATPVPADIADAIAARASRLAGFAARLEWFETVASTNDTADRLALDGAPHGTVVIADAQTSGRGRMGRTWFSPPGAGLYVSVVLRPATLLDPAEAGTHGPSGVARPGVSPAAAITLTAGVAIAEAIQAATGLRAEIKWPNDLVVGRRKLCGILAEASTSGSTLRHVVLGYGINVREAAFPPEIADRATSLETELGRPIARSDILPETLARLAELLGPAGGAVAGEGGTIAGGRAFAQLLERWRALSPSSSGSPVEVLDAHGGWVSGTTAGIDDDGALLVSVGGVPRRVIAGEVRWRT